MPLTDEAQHDLLFILTSLIFILFATGAESSKKVPVPPPTVIPAP